MEDKKRELRDWDLWGPLIFSMVISIFISMSSSAEKDDDAVFGTVYLTLFGGAALVGLNTYLVSQFSSTFLMMSIMGYCLFPFVLASAIGFFFRRIIGFIGMSIICAGAYLWAVVSARAFFGDQVKQERRNMVVYPVALYYLFFAFYVLLTF